MKVVELRAGDGPVVHLFGGAGGSEDELADLAAALSGDPTVVAHVPAEGASGVGSVVAMAAVAARHVRSAQPAGPYRLLGYSLGGLMAMEVSRVLSDAGEEVTFVGMVDTFFDQRYWPTRLFVRATARRTAFHARAALDQSAGTAAQEIVRRGLRLSTRLARRFGRPEADASAGEPGSVQEGNVAVMRRWQPRTFDGPITLFAATQADFGCDLAVLWRPWLPDLTVRRIAADHTSLLQSPASVALLAGEVDRALQAAPGPLRVLVATTFRWHSAARLADHLREVDCAVEAVAPRRSPVHELHDLARSHPLSLMAPLRSLGRAIESSRADLVVPFDDRTRQALERVYADSDPASAEGARVREVIERSLGSPESFGRVYSRAELMRLAAASGIRCPQTVEVRSAADIGIWFEQHPGGAVLKTDGSWGGRGVAMVLCESAARRAWREMSGPPPLHRALKRLLLERDPWAMRALLRGTRPVVTIQELIEGRPATASVACAAGSTLGQVHAEVLQSDGPKGPATVVQLVDNADMSFAAKSVVASLRLSGLCGLDFVLDHAGQAHLIELNPRATPTAHLVGADGSDPLSSLRAAWGPELPVPRTAPRPEDLVVPLGQAAPSRTVRARTHFWLPFRPLPPGSAATVEGGSTKIASTRGTL